MKNIRKTILSFGMAGVLSILPSVNSQSEASNEMVEVYDRGDSLGRKIGSLNVYSDCIRLLEGDNYSLVRYQNHLGYIFQAYNLIPNLTVKENIEVGAYLSKSPLDLEELIKVLGLWEHKDKMPNQLSGGQQQRTAIGRAVVKNPDILLCDEPTGALDYNTSKDILALLEEINEKYKCTIIMVTHNDALKLMADKVIKLRDGQIRKEYINEVRTKSKDLDW